MSQQRERGFLPVFRPERLHNLVKSAPNLENNKSRSSTVSTSTENIPLGNSASAFCDLVTSTASSVNSHHYTNTNYHSIYYERDLTKGSSNGGMMRDGKNDSRKASTTSSFIPSSSSSSTLNQNHSTESVDYNSDDSEHAASVGCFSFVNASSHDAKKIKNRYKKLPKEGDFEKPLLPNKIPFPKPSSSSMSSGSKKINNDPKKKIQFQEYSNSPKAEFNVDLTFYKRFEQSLDALGDQESSEQDIIYITSKPSKNKLALRLQKSLDAIDSIDISDTVESERIYSKSIDDLSTGDYQWHRGGSQFTWECFLKNGGTRKNGYEARTSRNDDSESSQEFKTGTFS